MKQYILTLLFLLTLSGCFEDETVDPTVMPEETTVGANTFGCLINGWVYVSGRYMDFIWGGLEFLYEEEEGYMYVSALLQPEKRLSFYIIDPAEGETTTITNLRWDGNGLPDGTATISRLDTINKIISGRFQAGSITEGRFDAVYTK